MELSLPIAATKLTTSKIGFKQTILEFLNFAIRPTLIQEESAMSVPQKLSYLFQLLKFKLLLLFVTIPILEYTTEAVGAVSIKMERGIWVYLTIVLFGPILEEIMFRYILRFSKSVFALFISFILGYFSYRFQEDNVQIFLGIFGSICLIPLIRYALSNIQYPIERLWNKAFPFIFHGLAIAFGLIHLSNYENISNYFLAIPLVSSQLVAGYIYGFIRMKFGLKYSIILHSAWNFTLSFVLLIDLVAKYF